MRLVVALLVCLPLVASASPTLAIMPLSDLAGGRASVGAAFRETLTVDLGHTPNLRVVEREVIDRVLREQSVDPGRVLEGVLGVRVGTLLGASHLVLGAYQRQGDKLRVTARVVDVATGVVVGSAKVDGTMDHMLDLQDQLSATLLVAVGWKGALPKRSRPRLAPRSVEQFGDAVLEPDASKKKALLAASISGTPQFSYAVDALAQLEGRLSGYEQTHAQVLSAREAQLLKNARDPKQRAELLATATTSRRYHALLAACDALSAEEATAYHRFVALDGLRRIDQALAAGEALLHAYPASPHFAEVEKRLRELADVRRTQVQRRADYDKDLADKASSKGYEHDFAPCIAARWNRQYNALMLDGCRGYVKAQSNATDANAKDHLRAARLFIVLALGELGRFDEARAAIADFRAHYPEGDSEIDDRLAIWPTD